MRFIARKSDEGKYYFIIQDARGEVIATSRLWWSKEELVSQIKSIETGLPRALVLDLAK